MDSKARFRVVNISDAYTKVTSSEEAFILSRITEEWISAHDLFVACGTFDEAAFCTIIDDLVNKGIIESNTPEKTAENAQKKKTVQTQKETALMPPVERRYPTLDIETLEISDQIKQLDESVVKEVMFLSYYGGTMDYYRRLGLHHDPFSHSISTIRGRIIKYHTFFTQLKRLGADSRAFLFHVNKAEQLIEETKSLLDRELKKQYDEQLKLQGKYTTDEEKHRMSGATLHFKSAQTFMEEGNLSRAKSEIKIARHLAPNNEEFSDLERKITALTREAEAKKLITKLLKDETLMWDERIMQKTIAEIFAIEDSPKMRLVVARVLNKKNAFQTAIDVLNDIDEPGELESEIDTLTTEIKKRYKEYKSRF